MSISFVLNGTQQISLFDSHAFLPERKQHINAPINVIVGALILIEFIGLNDDKILEECKCDFRYQYVLHTISYDAQPISDRTFSRFRECVAAYELLTGIDLIHKLHG